MSFAAVIEAAARDRAIRAAEAERAAEARRQELRDAVAEIPAGIDKRRKEYRDLMPEPDLGPDVDWREWRDWLSERKGKMRLYEMAAEFTAQTGLPCTWLHISGAMVGLRLIDKPGKRGQKGKSINFG